MWAPVGDGRRINSMRKANDREQAATHTDLAKLDAHEARPEEYEDIPELTDEFSDNAEIRRGDMLTRRGRGRPPLEVKEASKHEVRASRADLSKSLAGLYRFTIL